MARKIRIVIVDDSAFSRKLLSKSLADDPSMEVVGSAEDGRMALSLIGPLKPDVVTLDLEMPGFDGLTTLQEIRKAHPFLPVIIFSSRMERYSDATVDVMVSGANSYVLKPSTNSIEESIEVMRYVLIPKIKALCPWAKDGAAAAPAALFQLPPATAPKVVKGARIKAVVVGSSTGGPNALAELVPNLTADFPVPILIVQHMPPIFTKVLAERLAANAKIKVREAVAGDPLAPGGVWIAPGGRHMALTAGDGKVFIETNEEPEVNSCRPSVDVLFKSAAKIYGNGVLGVILTGMGADGLGGCRDVHAAGGTILAQDKATSVMWSMPGAVVEAGLADKTVPIKEMSAEIQRRVRG